MSILMQRSKLNTNIQHHIKFYLKGWIVCEPLPQTKGNCFWGRRTNGIWLPVDLHFMSSSSSSWMARSSSQLIFLTVLPLYFSITPATCNHSYLKNTFCSSLYSHWFIMQFSWFLYFNLLQHYLFAPNLHDLSWFGQVRERFCLKPTYLCWSTVHELVYFSYCQLPNSADNNWVFSKIPLLVLFTGFLSFNQPFFSKVF